MRARSLFLFLLLNSLTFSLFATSMQKNTEVSSLLLKAVKNLKTESVVSVEDPYKDTPNALNPEATKPLILSELGGMSVEKIVLTSYNLPPSANVPKVWLSLKMQGFLKEPIRLNTYVLKPKDFDVNKKSQYPVAILSHGSGGHIALQLWYGYNLVQKGFVVFIPDHFGAVGRECSPTDVSTFRIEANAIDLVRLADYAQSQPCFQKQNVFLMGWSLGGMCAEMAARASFTNAIAPHVIYNSTICFYPQIVVQELTPLHKSNILFFIPEHDDYTPARNILNYVERMHTVEGLKDKINYLMVKGSYHNFDGISHAPWREYWLLTLYNWSVYEGMGRTLVNWLGQKISGLIFGAHCYQNLQTFKEGQVLIDTQNPLRGYAPLNDIKDHSSIHDIDALFKPWETFQKYFATHLSHGARIVHNPDTAKWAMDEFNKYIDAHLVKVEITKDSVNTGKVD